jgi:RNA recognition motif. (a.k.a. RRM, RBD, or RNP domain)
MADKDKHEINHKLVDVKRAQARGVAPPSIHERQMAAAVVAASRLSSTDGGGAGDDTHSMAGSHTGDATSSYGPPSSSAAPDPTPEQMYCKVFVGGIPPQVDREELKTIFEQFGCVVDAIVMMDQITQRSRCFGFVTFDPADGQNAAQRSIQAQPLNIHGRSVEVKLATPRAEPPGTAAAGPGQPVGAKRALPPGPKHLGLRAGQASATSATGEFAGLAVAYGRSGWKAGYGTKAFGKAGWNVWEDTGGPVPDKAGFSFAMLRKPVKVENDEIMGPPIKRSRH